MAGSPGRYRSGSDQPKPRTGRCPVTGKAICSSVATTQPDRHAGGAPDALRDAGEGGGQGHRDRGGCAHQAGAQAAAGTLHVTDLGPRLRDGRAPPAISAPRWMMPWSLQDKPKPGAVRRGQARCRRTGRRFDPQVPGRGANTPGSGSPHSAQQPSGVRPQRPSSNQSRSISNAWQRWHQVLPPVRSWTLPV